MDDELPDRSRADCDLRREVKSLLEFVVGRPEIKVDDALILRVVKATTFEGQASIEQEAELWACYNALATLIRPATPESVKAITALVGDETARPGLIRYYWRDAPARRQIFRAIVWMLFILAALIPLQTYSLAVSSVLQSIDFAEAQRQQAQEKFKILNTANQDDPSVKLEVADVNGTVWYFNRMSDASYQMLVRLTRGWTEFVSCRDGDCASEPQQVLLRINAKNAATAFIKAFSLYVLPMLYGLLGANVYILRSIITKLDTWSLTVVLGSEHNLRRALGGLLGATLGLLFDTDKAVISAAGFSLAMLSFLGGYSADFIFNLMDAFLDRAGDAFAKKKNFAGEVTKVAPPATTS